MQYNIMQIGTLFKQWTSVYSLDPLFTRLYWSISLYCSLAIYLHISFSITSSKVDDKLIAQGLLELLHVEFLLCGYSVVERKGGIVLYMFCVYLKDWQWSAMFQEQQNHFFKNRERP